MKYTINDKVVLSRAPEGPLADHLGSFTECISEQGYAARSVWQRVHLAACFSSWLGKQGIRLRSISSEHPSQYLRYRTRRVRPTRSDVAALRHLLDFLRHESLIKSIEQLPAPEQERIRRWLNEKGVTNGEGQSSQAHANRSAKSLRWLHENREKYPWQWVALDGDRLIASGPTAKEVYPKAKAEGVEIPLLNRSPTKNQYHLPEDGFRKRNPHVRKDSLLFFQIS